MASDEPMSEGTRVAGRYLIEGHLARGGMADVYRTLDETSGRRVVLKCLRPELAARKNVALLFQREYHTLAQIKHPRIIEVYDYGIDRGQAFYTMELLDGVDLRELAPLPWREACGYLRDVASSLALLHTRRMLHRDLSPRNVRRTGDGRAKLIDFGTMASFGVPRDVVGTAPFVPPEALRGGALDQRSDLYSLGALAYWLLTRHHAYRARRIEELQDVWRKPPVPPSQLARELPGPLEDLVSSLLSMDPAARPGNAADVIERLDAIAGLESEELGQAAHSYLLSSGVVGRDSELMGFQRLLSRALESRGAAVVLEANPGVGRTRLLSEVALRAQLEGALVVTVSAEAAPGHYGVLRALIARLLRVAPGDTRNAAAPYLPVLLDLLPGLGPEELERAVASQDPSEQRARQQQALLSMILELSRHRPLALLVDDFHRADEASAALLAALARECRERRMLVVASVKLGSSVSAPDALRVFRQSAKSLRLHRLRRRETAELLESLFGTVPHVDRLAGWIHDVTTGNPTQIMELAHHLVDTDRISYGEGFWVLPAEVDFRAVPDSLARSLGVRLGVLSPEARELAATLSVAEAPLGLDVARRLSECDDERFLARADELLAKGVLESSAEGLSFVHAAMRELVFDQTPPEERAAAHLRLGKLLLEDAEGDGERAMIAALHLMRGGEQLEGAQLAARHTSVRLDDLPSAERLQALEEAARIHVREGLSTADSQRLRTVLVGAGYAVDRRLAYRYGEPLLIELSEASGLARAGRLRPLLGARIGLYLALGVAAIRRLFVGRRRRPPSLASSIAFFLGASASLLGAMATGIDVSGVRRVFLLVEPALSFPARSAPRAVAEFSRLLLLLMSGREHEHRTASRALVKELDDPGYEQVLGAGGRSLLLGGALLGMGTVEAYFANGQGMRVAERLERDGTGLGAVAASRIRLIHHLMRGESELAEPHRRMVELHALQGGTTWQVELWSAVMESLASHLTEDYIRLKQLDRALERLLPEVPSLRNYAELVDARMAFRQRRLQEARTRIGELVETMAPRQSVGWDVARLALAEVLMAQQLPGAAHELMKETLAFYDSEADALQIVRVMCSRTLALADAQLGRLELARARIDSELERVMPSGHPALLTRLHEAGAELALTADDRVAAMAHLSSMQQTVDPTRNPALIGLYQRVLKEVEAHAEAEQRQVRTDSGLDGVDSVTAVSRSPVELHVERLLEGAEGAERGGRLLRIALTRAGAASGHLFGWRDGELLLLASTAPDEIDGGLEQRVRVRLEEQTDAGASSGEQTAGTSSPPSGSDGGLQMIVLALPGEAPLGLLAIARDLGSSAKLPPAFLRAVVRQLSSCIV
ncbi:MAG: AAA family ATPase [Myxococcales bacterium]|nr:AAA family ATPase [Myxococcales bacterium]